MLGAAGVCCAFPGGRPSAPLTTGGLLDGAGLTHTERKKRRSPAFYASMRIRSLAVAAALFFVPATASAQELAPLTGTGENVAPIARLKLPGVVTEIALAGDWAFVATDAIEEQCGCLYIVNISDPTKPYVQGTFDAAKTELKDQSYGDVDISPDGNLAVLTNAHGSGPTWAVLIDTTDKANPKLLSKVDDEDGTIEYVHTSTLDNNTLYMNPQVWAGYPQPGHEAITVVDITDRKNPKQVGKITSKAPQVGLAHDTYVDHRPDGKTLLYSGSMAVSDVFDITDPLKSSHLQTIYTPDVTISHDVQPNHDRTVILVDDEGALGGQVDEQASGCGKAGVGPATANSGSLHFFAAAADGTFADNGTSRLGTFNAPANVNEGACVAHVFWQAPDENRITQAYYNVGAWVIDFTDPANAEALGYFDADGAKYWSNKAHKGYMYATNMNGSMDVMRYTGEDGKRWPTTAGPAEVQHAQRQGVEYVPIPGTTPATVPAPGEPGTSARAFGRFRVKLKGRKIPGRRGAMRRLTLTIADGDGARVKTLRLKRRTGRRAKGILRGVAAAGTYRYALRVGKRKRLARGTFEVAPVAGLRSSTTIVARVRRAR